MKIAKLTKVIKKNNRSATFFINENTMWIGTRSAIFPLYGMPVMNPDQLLTLLDIPNKDYDSFEVNAVSQQTALNIKNQLNEVACNNDYCYFADGFPIKYENKAISKSLQCFQFGNDIKFIDTDFIEIIDCDEPQALHINYFNDTFIISEGFCPVAIIKSFDAISEELVEYHKKLYTVFSKALAEKKAQTISDTEEALNQISFELLSELK